MNESIYAIIILSSTILAVIWGFFILSRDKRVLQAIRNTSIPKKTIVSLLGCPIIWTIIGVMIVINYLATCDIRKTVINWLKK